MGKCSIIVCFGDSGGVMIGFDLDVYLDTGMSAIF